MTTRRAFLQGLGAASATPLAAMAAAPVPDAAADPARAPRQAVHLQQPYIDFDGTGDTYTPPAANHANRTYCESIGTEEFLRRHWFA